MPATTSAAIGSAFISHGAEYLPASITSASPRITTALDQMSVLKCNASACSAWLSYFCAMRRSRRERQKSTTIDIPITTKAHTVARFRTEWKNSRLRRFVDDPDAGQQQQAGFDESGEALDLAVTVLMVGIGRLVGDANREVSDRRGHQIEARVRRLGEDAQAAGGDADHHLQAR